MSKRERKREKREGSIEYYSKEREGGGDVIKFTVI